MAVALHVNVDHVATLRQARGTSYPDPVRAALLCELAGAAGITVHLREDRRHIQDRDVELLRTTVTSRLNLEMAATSEMLDVALRIRPDLVTLVPERRQEQTTEGGLDVAQHASVLGLLVAKLSAAQIPTSMFIDPSRAQVDASASIGAVAVELHTGDYAHASGAAIRAELERLADAAEHAATRHATLHVAAGHGLTVRNVGALVQRVEPIVELNIGHAIIADAVLLGIEETVSRFQAAIDEGESRR